MTLDAPASLIVCAGRSGSGKTTFALKYLLNAPAACRFVFDDRGQAAQRLKITPSATAAELEAALCCQWVIFSPHRMFPGRLEAAFQFFCGWVFTVSQRGPGKKIILVDEVWRWCTPYAIPQELANIVQTGRVHEIELVTCTQRPNKLNGAITNEATEAVLFTLQENAALEWVESLGCSRDAVKNLPKGQFLALNLDTGGRLSGKLW